MTGDEHDYLAPANAADDRPGVTGETPNPLHTLRELIDTDHHHRCDTHHGGECDCYARRTAPHRTALAQVEALADWAHEALATLRDLGCQHAPFVCEFITNDEGCEVCELLQREAALVPFAAHQDTA